MKKNKPMDLNQPGRLSRWTAGLTGRRLILMVVSALLMVLMFPTADLEELAWLAVVPLLFALDGLPRRSVFTAVFITFLMAKGGTIYWLVYTINHYGFIHIVPAVLIFLLLIGTMSLLWGLTFYAAMRLIREGRMPLALVIPMTWVAQEWVQSWLLGGFPWSLIGYAPAHRLLLVQSADLFGVWGLSFLIVLVNAALYEVISFGLKRRERFPTVAITIALVLFFANLIYGHFRLEQVQKEMAEARSFKVAVLQGNIDQNEKWRDPAIRKQTPDMYLEMAKKADKDKDLSLIILPETALPIWQERGEPLRGKLSKFGTATENYVLFGCPTKGFDENEERVNYNSAGLVSPQGKELGWYHKNKLVPFGEYIPLKKILQKLLGRLIHGTGNFQAWGRISLLQIPEGKFGVIICFETIFPDLARRIVNQGATFLPNITNDAWFGDTSAPHQHMQMVAFRAIENRMYVPRAANTGISGIVDPTGRIVHQTQVYVRNYYVGEVKTMNLPTLYRKVGDLLAYLCAAGFALLAVIFYFRLRRPEA